jgi:hypothetical protein
MRTLDVSHYASTLKAKTICFHKVPLVAFRTLDILAIIVGEALHTSQKGKTLAIQNSFNFRFTSTAYTKCRFRGFYARVWIDYIDRYDLVSSNCIPQ